MFPDTIFRFFKVDGSRKEEGVKNEVGWVELNLPYSVSTTKEYQDPYFTRSIKSSRLSLRSDKPLNSSKMNNSNNNVGRIRKGEKKMGNKVRNISELIQRVTPSCLLTTPSPNHHEIITDDDMDHHDYVEDSEDDEEFCQDRQLNVLSKNGHIIELEMLIGEVFEAVSNLKGAYISVQRAHCPWDADKMRLADVGVVAELKRLGVLWERFRRSGGGDISGGKWRLGAAMMKEVVAPYEAAVEGLKREVKSKEMMIVELKEKVKMATIVGINGGSKRRGKLSRRKVCCLNQVGAAPGPELFESTMGLVIDAAKSFTAMLLSLMGSAHWDIVAAVRSIESASVCINSPFTTTNADSIVGANHSKYALESFVNRKMFQSFDHETFNMDGSLSSLLNPDQYREACFTLFKDMKDMDPVELVNILPTCSFGNFCFKKYLTIVHPKMEESLFGDLEQRRQVLDKHHPISKFYGEFLGLAKVVWLLHLLAFSSDPPLSRFEAGRGVEFHPEYMETVVTRNPRGERRDAGHFRGRQVVGFPVSPGFKLGDESVIKARVYLLQNNEF